MTKKKISGFVKSRRQGWEKKQEENEDGPRFFLVFQYFLLLILNIYMCTINIVYTYIFKIYT